MSCLNGAVSYVISIHGADNKQSHTSESISLSISPSICFGTVRLVLPTRNQARHFPDLGMFEKNH
jgi:hypothetical protein